MRDNYFSSYHLSGILIDSFMYEAIKGWHFLLEGEQHFSGNDTFEKSLLKYYNEISLNGYIAPQIKAPGSKMDVYINKSWEMSGKILRYLV